MILSRSCLGAEGTETVPENYDGRHQSCFNENPKSNTRQSNAPEPLQAKGLCSSNLLPASPVEHFIRPYFGDYKKEKMSHVDMARSGLYRVGSVISPHHLVLQPLAFWAPDGWHNELQNFYDHADRLVETRIKTSRVYKGHLYAWKDTTTFGWCRVLIESLDLLEGLAIVNVVDEAVRKRVMTNDLYELSQQFWSFPSMGWKFRLSNIKPTRNQREWPKAAIDRLTELCKRGDDVMGCVPATVTQLSPVVSTVPLMIYRVDSEESVQNVLLSSRLADRKHTYRWDKSLEEASLEDLQILDTMVTQDPTNDTTDEPVDFWQ